MRLSSRARAIGRLRVRRSHAWPRWRHWRHQPRVAAPGLTVAVEGAPGQAATVLDVSEGGILVVGLALAPGAPVEFELHGQGLRGSGSGFVVRRADDGSVGIAVRRWDGTLDTGVRDMIDKALLASSTWRELYLDNPVRPRPRP